MSGVQSFQLQMLRKKKITCTPRQACYASPFVRLYREKRLWVFKSLLGMGIHITSLHFTTYIWQCLQRSLEYMLFRWCVPYVTVCTSQLRLMVRLGCEVGQDSCMHFRNDHELVAKVDFLFNNWTSVKSKSALLFIGSLGNLYFSDQLFHESSFTLNSLIFFKLACFLSLNAFEEHPHGTIYLELPSWLDWSWQPEIVPYTRWKVLNQTFLNTFFFCGTACQ